MAEISTPRRWLVLVTPPLFALLTMFHPSAHPKDLRGGEIDTWLAVHTGQLVLTVLLGYAVWTLLEGLSGRGAVVARAALPIFMVAFSAFDSVAGLATGWLAHTAEGQTGAEREGTLDAIETLFIDNWLTGNLSVAGGVTAVAWLCVAVGTAVALKRAGADRWTVALAYGSALFLSHPPPLGALGLLALFGAAWRWDRRSRRQPVAQPAALTHLPG